MGTKFAALACHICNEFSCKQEARFLDHLTDVHGIDDHEACFVEHAHGGVRPTCECSPECKAPVKWGGWKKGYVSRFARGHNARLDSVYFKPEFQEAAALKRAEGYASGRNKIWCEGLTKETDERLAVASTKKSKTLTKLYESGHPSWQTGLTKETDSRLKQSSETHKARYASGELKNWNAGLTKAVDPRVAQLGNSIKMTRAIVKWGQLSDEEVERRVKLYVPNFDLVVPIVDHTNKYHYYEVRCKECGKTSLKTLAMMSNTPVCFLCHPKESKGQLELFEFIKSLVPDAVLSTRNVIAPMELDVWVPSKKFGVEYDGLYWHSELFVGDDHAQRKLEKCREAGITFFRVFEDEWESPQKRELIQHMIRHRLGATPVHGPGARKCQIVELEPSVRREFFEANHLDGDVRSQQAWGLTHEGTLLAALSVRKPFHASHAATHREVARFASLAGVSVAGGLSRLASHALRESKLPLMTYVDGRLGQGRAYELAGFKRTKETAPRFWWTDFEQRYDRFSIRADSANGITQKAAAEAAGVVRIFGCSNSVFELAVQ